ncbi:SDR family oxidoreductase [Sphingosinicella terrae]|uniref:SDR family oxidoreductase n=1 Tax=Sphingosinicella terrae TaxID=2172047 RepID=UPI000E0DBC34|nr:SDR family oxidoreductase [Sphingosinicella terrae]
MSNILVIGATGDVGRGIVEILLEHGHRVVGAARKAGRLEALANALGHPPRFATVAGSLASDAEAEALREAAQRLIAPLDAVVVSVNAPRQSMGPILDKTTEEVASLVRQDLISHFTAARAFLPALTSGGTYVGIGGGTADFLLPDGVYMSLGQAALRMMYRGIARETSDRPIHLRELIVASVVNGASTRDAADPLWVTDREIGEQVAAIVADPGAFPETIQRISRRDASGKPLLSAGN